MHFQWKSVPADQFAAWTAGARANGPVLDRAAYDALKQQSHNVRPYTYRAVQPGLFQAITAQKIPPGPGPTPEAPNMPGARSRPFTRRSRCSASCPGRPSRSTSLSP